MPQNPQAPPPPPPLRASVVVVSHNRRQSLQRCLAALEAAANRAELEVIVVDNGSKDGSAELEVDFPQVRFIRVPRNFGLTKALNIGVRACAETDYILFLHDDTELASDAVALLMRALDSDAEAVAACPRLAGGAQVGVFPPDGEWRAAPESAATVDYARGAALAFRSFFIKAMRHIDERYGQFGWDADLCFQARRAGRKILLVNEAHATHQGGEETPLGTADRKLGSAAFVGKYQGFAAGLRARITATLGALAGFRLSEFRYLAAGQKIDGTQSQ